MTVLHRDLHKGHKYSPVSRSMIISVWSRFLVVFWTASKYLKGTENKNTAKKISGESSRSSKYFL